MGCHLELRNVAFLGCHQLYWGAVANYGGVSLFPVATCIMTDARARGQPGHHTPALLCCSAFFLVVLKG